MVNKITKLLLLPLCAAAVLGAAVGCGGTSSSTSSEDEFDVNSNPGTEGFNMWIVGSAWSNWTPDEVTDDLKFTNVTGTAKLTYTVTISAADDENWWGFKFVGQKSWNPSQFGMEDIDYEKCNDAFKELVKTTTITEDDTDGVTTYEEYKAKWKAPTSNRSNVSFCQNKKTVTKEDDTTEEVFTHVGAGTYKFTYDPLNFESESANETTYSHKIVVEFTKAE